MSTFDAQSGRNAPSDSQITQAQADSDNDEVIAALSDLSQMVSDVDEIEAVLAEVAGFALVAVPGADGVGVTLLASQGPSPAALAWSVTHDFVREIDRLQYEVCREGPCLTAMESQRSLVSGSLGSDKRWPRFGGRVARLSVHSALALPLLVRGAVVGAINVYARDRDVFGEHAVSLGERFARPAAVSVLSTYKLHLARERAAQLQTALGSRAVIDQAVGIIRSRSGASAAEALDRLRRSSQADGVRLAVIAERLVDEAVRGARSRTGHT